MNHSAKIRRNHEFSSLKLRNHELREIVKRIMNNEMSFPTIFETGDYVLFQKRVRGFHQVSKHEKTFETTRPQAEWFYCFRVFGNLMKPEARVFVITSPTKKIRSTYHFNEFSRFKYSICGS